MKRTLALVYEANGPTSGPARTFALPRRAVTERNVGNSSPEVNGKVALALSYRRGRGREHAVRTNTVYLADSCFFFFVSSQFMLLLDVGGRFHMVYSWQNSPDSKDKKLLSLSSKLPTKTSSSTYRLHISNNTNLTNLSLFPSNFRPFKMQQQPVQIRAQQIGDATGNVLVYDDRNPGYCPCGWYCFYSSICGHLYQQYPYRCGNTTTPSGKSGFCKIPAPQNVVQGYTINARCADCRRRAR